MAEFLIRIRDKQGHNAKLLGEREVVSVCPDGWQWSQLEQKNPDWRILKVPGMSVEEAEQFEVPEPVDETRYVRRRRAFKIDILLLPVDVQANLLNDRRDEPTKDVDGAVLVAAKAIRIPLPRDDVIAPLDVIKSLSANRAGKRGDG